MARKKVETPKKALGRLPDGSGFMKMTIPTVNPNLKAKSKKRGK